MELRASRDVAIGEDITPAISPIACALHDRFLPYRCSSCFQSLNSSGSRLASTFISCSAACPVRYCSSECFFADSCTHRQSGECRLLQFDLSACDESADIRLALRLLIRIEQQGFDVDTARIAGLMVNRVNRGSLAGLSAMSRARNSQGSALEETALCLLRTNAVEVQAGDATAFGVAVYGPLFSWFNHSCAPNACYRFELAASCNEHITHSDSPVIACGEESVAYL